MNDIEQKAQAMVSEVRSEWGASHDCIGRDVLSHEALCRAIEQHEDFKQKVSDALLRYHAPTHVPHGLQDLIIPAPKPDPLVEAYLDVFPDDQFAQKHTDRLRWALDALGFEIREKDDD